MRIALIANSDKPDALAASTELAALLAGKAEILEITADHRARLTGFIPELIVVLGGDGTILQMARAIYGINAVIAGINFGKLGYLAAFSLDQFKKHLPLILSGHAPVTERLMLHGSIHEGKANSTHRNLPKLPMAPALFESVALNDIVINAGDPFRMIELHVKINQQETVTFRSDGVIVSTSSGSTGYNLSAGGPLISPDVHAMVLTPICPHSLSFRPVVVSDTAAIVIHPHRVNPGTKVNFDGQLGNSLTGNQYLVVRRAEAGLRLMENPDLSHWQMLDHKLHWARSPRH